MTFPSCHPAFWKLARGLRSSPLGPSSSSTSLPGCGFRKTVERICLLYFLAMMWLFWLITKVSAAPSGEWFWNIEESKTSFRTHTRQVLTSLMQGFDSEGEQLINQYQIVSASKSTCSTHSLLPKFYPDHRIIASLLSHNSWSQGAMLSESAESEKSGGSSGWSCSSKARLWWSKQQHRGSSGITEAHKCRDHAAIFWRSVMEATCRNLTYWFLKTCHNASQYGVFSVWYQAPNHKIVESKYSKTILQIICESYVIATLKIHENPWDIHAQVVQASVSICFDLFRPTRRLGNAPVKDNCHTYCRHRLFQTSSCKQAARAFDPSYVQILSFR